MNTEFNKHKLIVNLLLIGVVRSLQLNKLDYYDAHQLVFSPGGWERMRKNKNLTDFADAVYMGMELEDAESLCGIETYYKELVEIEKQLLELLVIQDDNNELHEVSKIITSLGLDSTTK